MKRKQTKLTKQFVKWKKAKNKRNGKNIITAQKDLK